MATGDPDLASAQRYVRRRLRAFVDSLTLELSSNPNWAPHTSYLNVILQTGTASDHYVQFAHGHMIPPTSAAESTPPHSAHSAGGAMVPLPPQVSDSRQHSSQRRSPPGPIQGHGHSYSPSHSHSHSQHAHHGQPGPASSLLVYQLAQTGQALPPPLTPLPATHGGSSGGTVVPGPVYQRASGSGSGSGAAGSGSGSSSVLTGQALAHAQQVQQQQAALIHRAQTERATHQVLRQQQMQQHATSRMQAAIDTGSTPRRPQLHHASSSSTSSSSAAAPPREVSASARDDRSPPQLQRPQQPLEQHQYQQHDQQLHQQTVPNPRPSPKQDRSPPSVSSSSTAGPKASNNTTWGDNSAPPPSRTRAREAIGHISDVGNTGPLGGGDRGGEDDAALRHGAHRQASPGNMTIAIARSSTAGAIGGSGSGNVTSGGGGSGSGSGGAGGAGGRQLQAGHEQQEQQAAAAMHAGVKRRHSEEDESTRKNGRI